EWREGSGWARQNFRYLAETSQEKKKPKAAERQKKLELVLNLEQSSTEDLQAQPLPQYNPQSKRKRPCDSKKERKNQKPPGRKGDARGAGGVGEIEGGW